MPGSVNNEQIERAKTVNLPEFLMANGFELKKVGTEYVWKEHDSLHIKNNAPGERGEWFRFSTHQGGDNIDFVRQFMNKSFVEAVEMLSGERAAERSYVQQHSTPPKKSEPEKPKDIKLYENDNANRVYAYLCKTRGLDYNLVSELVKNGSIAQEQKTGNVLFKYFDENKKVVGAEKVGTSTEHRFKGIEPGSASGYGFEVVRGKGENAFFFESAIDMLSYLQKNNKDLQNCRLVSMMGVKPNTVIDTMKRNNIAPENVYLCSDNDKAGNEFAERLQAEYPQMKRLVTPDIYKDWNDMLRDIRKPEPVKEDEKSLVSVTEEITKKNKHFTELVNSGEFSQANEISQQLSELNDKADLLKKDIQEENITINDIEVLRSIEPKRKSVQNMLETEVAKTPKFEKLLNEELGEKSAYEMRNGNNEWLKDDSKTIPIINVQKRDIPEKLSDIRKQNDIPRGSFVNKDTGIEIQFSRKSINEIVAKAIPDVQRNIPVEARMATLYQMQELIENAVCFDSQLSDYDPVTSKNKSPNSLFIHRMHGVIDYDNKKYLANLSIEESYITDKENKFNGTSNRLYSFRDIEITPVELLGDQAYAGLQKASEDTPSGVIKISVPQLYDIVKALDRRFFENEKSPGRAEREKEIAEHNEYLSAVKKLEEHNNEKSLNEKGMLNMPTETKNEKIDLQVGNKIQYDGKEYTITSLESDVPNSIQITQQGVDGLDYTYNIDKDKLLSHSSFVYLKDEKNADNEKGMLNMPVQEMSETKDEKTEEVKVAEPETAAIPKEQEPEEPQEFVHSSAQIGVKKTTQFHEPITHDKLIPFLNLKANHHTNRLADLKEKRDTQSAKLQKNISKIEKLTAKAERLEDMNKMLTSLSVALPGIKKLIARNEKKIKAIREVKIPARKEKVKAHRERIEQIDRKSEIIGHKLERCVALSNSIRSFGLIGKERRQVFAKSMSDLSTATYNCTKDKLNKVEVKLENNPYDYNLKNKSEKLKEKLNKFEKLAVQYNELSDNQIDKAIENTKQAIYEKLAQGTDSLSEISENVIDKNISDMELHKVAELQEIKNKYPQLSGEIDKMLSSVGEQNVQKQADEKATMNPDYFKSLPKDKRFVKAGLSVYQAKLLGKQLDNQNIKYSAVLDGNQSKITIDKDDTHLLDDKTKAMFEIGAEKKARHSINSMLDKLDNAQKQAEQQNHDVPQKQTPNKNDMSIE